MDQPARGRTLTLAVSRLTAQQLAEIACGAVGLVGRFTGQSLLVNNPQSSESLPQQRDSLLEESGAAWRRFFLRCPQDGRIAQGHYALAGLYEASSQVAEAIREHQLVAGRFPRDPAAPYALLACARLRLDMGDFNGARTDLLSVLDGYPDCPALGDVYLSLGNACLSSGRLEEAAQTFKKLYYCEVSAASRRQACLGAGTALLYQGQHRSAIEWLERYVESAGGEPDLAAAYTRLGQCHAALGQHARSAAAFRNALSQTLSRTQRIETVLELAKAQAGGKRITAAFETMNLLAGETLTRPQTITYSLAMAGLYRQAGLTEQAVSVLRRGLSQSDNATPLVIELARCHVELEQLPAAMSLLNDALPKADSQAQTHELTCLLADVCLQAGKSAQAATVLENLLKSPLTPDQRRPAIELLAKAYAAQKEYERAALALSELAPKPAGGGK